MYCLAQTCYSQKFLFRQLFISKLWCGLISAVIKKLQTPITWALWIWGQLESTKPILKRLPVSCAETMLTTGWRSFQRGSLGFLGQRARAAKLKAVKVKSLKQFFCPAKFKPQECDPVLIPRWLDQHQSLMACNFADLWPFETRNTSLEKFWPCC